MQRLWKSVFFGMVCGNRIFVAGEPRICQGSDSLSEQPANDTGLATSSEAGELEFVAMAERAIARGKNPPAMFHWLLNGRKPRYVTLADEDRAARRLKDHRNPVTDDVRAADSPPKLSEEHEFVQQCIRVARATADAPFDVARKLKSWTREHWELQHAGFELAQARRYLPIGELQPAYGG